ncbi:hypothetical protein F2Q70_00033728 [Brassica cretica]|uniref:APS kinase domain-containing protein n=1 Tax=Brassica cretica TaxID=69181 RepID=A0A8S9K0U9_BRACR|nr:hypothetical protein F2Q70_00033728 [Brassica cretica]
MEGLAIRASRPSIFCSLPGVGGDPQRRLPSDGFLNFPASSNAADNTKLVVNSGSFHPISAVNVSTQASLTADFPALSETNVKEERINGEKKADNIVWHESSICRCDRQQLLQQKGCVIWITGFTGIDDPYEAPLNCEVVLKHTGDDFSSSPRQMAENIICYLRNKGYLEG